MRRQLWQRSYWLVVGVLCGVWMLGLQSSDGSPDGGGGDGKHSVVVPEDAIVLFDGSSFDGWVGRDGGEPGWVLIEGGAMRVRPGAGDIHTTREFRDFRMHIEFLSPVMPGRTGQGRGNSGVFFHGDFEVQVLGSHGDDPQINNCGALYGIKPSRVNAAKPSGEWQAYDIIFRAPRFDAQGAVVENPRVTVIHNGVVIHNNVEIPAPAGSAAGRPMRRTGPIRLQDHGDPVEYRNIWIQPLEV